MNTKEIINYMNKVYGYNIDSRYYTEIEAWECWWRGHYKPFHEFYENGANGSRIKRELYTLKMAKKVCEDWASILLNEKTNVVIDDDASATLIEGVFAETDFWNKVNQLGEKAFAFGTGAVLIRVEGMNVDDAGFVDGAESTIAFDYLPAQNIIPISRRNGKITEAAFASEIMSGGEYGIYLQRHLLENGKYVIYNDFFTVGKKSLQPAALPDGVAPVFRTGLSVPLFAIVQPNITNRFPYNNGLGQSIFADALDSLKGVDLAFNNFNRDIKLGGKKVFMSKSLLEQDQFGKTITPDDVAQQLFTMLGDEDSFDKTQLIQEHNPDLRTQENVDAIQAQLDYLSFKCGLGTKHYQFNAGSIVTATQYTGDKQELVQNASKHYITIQSFLKQIVESVLWIGREIMGLPVNPDADCVVNFEDSFVIDKESERQRDMQEVRDGIMNKWEYRAKWYGEDEETAKANLPQQESASFFEE